MTANMAASWLWRLAAGAVVALTDDVVVGAGSAPPPLSPPHPAFSSSATNGTAKVKEPRVDRRRGLSMRPDPLRGKPRHREFRARRASPTWL